MIIRKVLIKHFVLQNSKYLQKGFTLIELLLYMGLVTIILSALIPFAWNIIEGGVKSSVQQEVFANGRYVSEIIKYEIRNSTGINSPVNPTSISLIKSVAADNPTIISLSSGKVTIKKGAATAVNLNSNDTTVTSLNFTDYTSLDNKTKNIQVNFTIGTNTTSTRSEYQQSYSIQTSAEVRSN